MNMRLTQPAAQMLYFTWHREAEPSHAIFIHWMQADNIKAGPAALLHCPDCADAAKTALPHMALFVAVRQPQRIPTACKTLASHPMKRPVHVRSHALQVAIVQVYYSLAEISDFIS